MVTELARLIDELSMRMRLVRTAQEAAAHAGDLSERDILMLELLGDRRRMTVSEIYQLMPSVSESTISTDISKIWRKKLVSKTINPDNQRMTFVELTQKGQELLTGIKKRRSDRLAMMFEAMNLTDDEREVLEKTIERAVEFFENYIRQSKNALRKELVQK